jgi:recombination protein RecR
MNSIDKLAEIFSHFPGIGPKQARRFVYYLLHRHGNFSKDLITAVENLKRDIVQCAECMRYFAKDGSTNKYCSICSNADRDSEMLMIVPRDIDLDAVEKSGSFRGYYFVLGGSLPVLDKEPEKRIRIKELRQKVENKKGKITEIILGMNANTEGENTADYLKEEIKHIAPDITVSILGRGLSTGIELEYADPDTLKNALLHRTK